jgi:hypothetical protein
MLEKLQKSLSKEMLPRSAEMILVLVVVARSIRIVVVRTQIE